MMDPSYVHARVPRCVWALVGVTNLECCENLLRIFPPLRMFIYIVYNVLASFAKSLKNGKKWGEKRVCSVQLSISVTQSPGSRLFVSAAFLADTCSREVQKK